MLSRTHWQYEQNATDGTHFEKYFRRTSSIWFFWDFSWKSIHFLRFYRIQVQCNLCKKAVARGQFQSHVRGNCVNGSPVTPREVKEIIENKPASRNSINDEQIQRHLSNVYLRIESLEKELFELRKNVSLALLVVIGVASFLFLSAIFSRVIFWFGELFFTEWIPNLSNFSTKLLFDFSWQMCILRLILSFVFLCFLSNNNRQRNENSPAIVACVAVFFLNGLVLFVKVTMNCFSVLVIFYFFWCIGRSSGLRLPSDRQFFDSVVQFFRRNFRNLTHWFFHFIDYFSNKLFHTFESILDWKWTI